MPLLQGKPRQHQCPAEYRLIRAASQVEKNGTRLELVPGVPNENRGDMHFGSNRFRGALHL